MGMKLFCPKCGMDSEVGDDKQGKEVPCPHCRHPIQIPIVTHGPRPVQPEPSIREWPRTPPSREAPRAEPPRGRGPAGQMVVKASGQAFFSFVLGLMSLLGGFACCGGVLPLVAIVTGHMALKQIGRDPAVAGRKLAVWGTIFGYAGLALAILTWEKGKLFKALMHQLGMHM